MNSLLKIATIVLIIGVIGVSVAPFLFTSSGCISFTKTGQIGDTIGGITAPITGLVGSVLVFLALKGQILTNKVTQEQIRDQKLEEQRKKEVIYISDLYKYFLNSIQAYETKYYRGHRAIMKVMSLLADSERKQAHDEGRLYYGTAAELYSLLKLGRLFLDQVNKSGLAEHDRRYFKELVKHHYESFILPYLAKNSEKPCPTCGEKHNGIPFKMSALIQETIVLF
jgi:phosphate/sulfate permease